MKNIEGLRKELNEQSAFLFNLIEFNDSKNQELIDVTKKIIDLLENQIKDHEYKKRVDRLKKVNFITIKKIRKRGVANNEKNTY